MFPSPCFSFINQYLELVGPIIRERNGFVDKYLGDGVMAIFPGDTDDACLAALDIVRVVPNIDREIGATVGVGLHRGPAMLGTIGEHDRLDTTVLSDAVNISSRLQALSGGYGVDVLASDTGVRMRIDSVGYYVRFADSVRLKGKTEPTTVYQVMPEFMKTEKQESDVLYVEAFEALRARRIEKTRELISRCISADSEDPLYNMMDKRIMQLNKTGFPNDWDGSVSRDMK